MKLSYIIITALSLSLMACGEQGSKTEHRHDHEHTDEHGHDHGEHDSHGHEHDEHHSQEEFSVSDSLSNQHHEGHENQEEHSHDHDDHEHPHNH